MLRTCRKNNAAEKRAALGRGIKVRRVRQYPNALTIPGKSRELGPIVVFWQFQDEVGGLLAVGWGFHPDHPKPALFQHPDRGLVVLGNPGKITEMDALVAYLQMLGTLVDFTQYDAKSNYR